MRILNFACRLGRHDRIILRANGRMSLYCVDCRRQTSGWDLTRSTQQQPGPLPRVVRLLCARVSRIPSYPRPSC